MIPGIRIAVVCGIMYACSCGIAIAEDAKTVVVTVNGEPITAGDVEFFGFSRGLSAEEQTLQRERLTERLIERQLVRGFLASKNQAADADTLNTQIHELEELVRRRGEQPAALFKKLGLTSDRIKSEIGLSIAWKAYIVKTTTPEEIRRIFTEHRAEYDGTRVKIRQVFRKAMSDDARKEGEALLTKARKEVEAKSMTFEGAVNAYSQAPSAQNAGDLGWVSRRGQMPDALTEAAWKLAPGEIAGPLISAYGVHLIQATDRVPGQLSVEDARPQILERISAQRWTETVTAEREKAKIVRPTAGR